MNLTTALARLLIFPGLLFAVPAAWFFLWVERKAVALMQGRIGPPFMQPFFDFIKLLGKTTPPRSGVGGLLMRAWPLIAVSAGGRRGWSAARSAFFRRIRGRPDPAAGAAGTSLHVHHRSGLFLALHLRRDRLGREAVLSVAYNVVFLLAIVSIAASQHTFRLEALAQLPASPLRWLGIAGHPGLPARQAASQSLLAAQCGAGDLLRTHDRIRRSRAGHVGAFAWAGVGCGYRIGGHAGRSRISPSGGSPS